MKQGLAIMGVDTDDHSLTKDRQTLQEIGIYFRKKDPNWWVNLLIKNVQKSFESGTEVVVVDDLRFKNEYDALAKLHIFGKVHVYLVHIEVSARTQALRGAAMDRLDHPSETDLDDYGTDMWDLWIPEETSVEQRVRWIEALVSNDNMLR